MKDHKIVVSGVGCCLMDRIYDKINFCSSEFSKYLSKTPGDGGLVPGTLELEEDFERFMQQKFSVLLPQITNSVPVHKENIGGPCIVALINAAQLTHEISEVCFYGCYGSDDVGNNLIASLRTTPIDLSHYQMENGLETASTVVLSDPDYDEGHGERIFVNTIGASWKYTPDKIDESFYNSDIVVFGGTAIVPGIHEELESLLKKAKCNKCITIVNTVFDSLSERSCPGKRWHLGRSDNTYNFIDLLITDREEALRLSGGKTIPESIDFFLSKHVGAVIVTNGAKDVYLCSGGSLFNALSITTMPISQSISLELKKHKGDTTGCGDNFVGGVIASIIFQKYDKIVDLDLQEACCWGVVSGGFACSYYGGTYLEKSPGEKKSLIMSYYEAYKKQINH